MDKADKLVEYRREISNLRKAINDSMDRYLLVVENWIRERRGIRSLSASRTSPERPREISLLAPDRTEKDINKSTEKFLGIIRDVNEVLKNSEVELIGETEEEHKERFEKYMALYEELHAASKELVRIYEELDKFYEKEIEPHRSRQNNSQELDPSS